MSVSARHSGQFKAVQDILARSGGTWRPVQEVWQRNNGVWRKVYHWEIVVTLTSRNHVNIQTLFSAADWSSTKIKRVIIPSGVTIGSTANGTPAMRTGTGWGGQLIIENAGNIHGAGGPANGGTGGTAFQADAAGVVLINSGAIRGGGGGGGRGGNGGNGTYLVVERTPASDWYYQGVGAGQYAWDTIQDDDNGRWNMRIHWDGTIVYSSLNQTAQWTATSHTVSGWTYLRGPEVSGTNKRFRIARQRSVSASSTGGAGGAGGRGQGHDAGRAAGSAGSAGGLSAGAGGTGGTGGLYGAAGSAGARGGNGNVSNGANGAGGGLAGFAIANSSRVSLTNTGTIQGRT